MKHSEFYSKSEQLELCNMLEPVCKKYDLDLKTVVGLVQREWTGTHVAKKIFSVMQWITEYISVVASKLDLIGCNFSKFVLGNRSGSVSWIYQQYKIITSDSRPNVNDKAVELPPQVEEIEKLRSNIINSVATTTTSLELLTNTAEFCELRENDKKQKQREYQKLYYQRNRVEILRKAKEKRIAEKAAKRD